MANRQGSLPDIDMEPTEMIDYLCRRRFGVTGGGVSRVLFMDELKSQPLPVLKSLYQSARAEHLRRRKKNPLSNDYKPFEQ